MWIILQWEVEEILLGEMFRNLSAALLVVLVIVAATLADPRACLFVLACILFTLVDVVGLSHAALGMTIDPFSTMCNVIGIGTCVDYAVHIAHAFLTSEGNREANVILTQSVLSYRYSRCRR